MDFVFTNQSPAGEATRMIQDLRLTNMQMNASESNKYAEHETVLSNYDPIEQALMSQQNQQYGYVQIRAADPQAFNDALIRERQQAIDNTEYRSTIESWHPHSLLHLSELIRTFANGKSLLDQYWIIFYWITSNINYDTVSYFSGQYGDQSAEAVFQRRQGVCDGYGNLYKYLCDQLKISCVKVTGYAKGYGFEKCTSLPSNTNHAWNAVEIDGHWYLLESTWGAGHLNENKGFFRELSTYYFLTRPNEMIYHHLPKEERWQLLEKPIGMAQYLQIPKLCPLYFELNMELISPRTQTDVNLMPGKPYALVLVRAPSDVQVMAALKLNDEKIESGHRVVFDHERQLYACYFSPNRVGNYNIYIFGMKSNKGGIVIEFSLNVNQLTIKPISFPKTWDVFSEFKLEVIAPKDTHVIQLNNGVNHGEVLIRAPENVLLDGRLEDEKRQEIPGGTQVYYDRHKNLWCCNFAPDRDGTFEALIIAAKKSNPDRYKSVVSFKIEARQIPSPPLSYPNIWQEFYDYDLEIQVPKNSAHVPWTDSSSYAEVLMKAPNCIELSCDLQYDYATVKNGSLAQFDHTKKLWQLLFAPQQTGKHKLYIYARNKDKNEYVRKTVVRLNLEVNKLIQPTKFPPVDNGFHNSKYQILSATDGVLGNEELAPFGFIIPGAINVKTTVDSKWGDNQPYSDYILARKNAAGPSEIIAQANFGEKPS